MEPVRQDMWAPSDLGSLPSSTYKPVASGESSDLSTSETSTHPKGRWKTVRAAVSTVPGMRAALSGELLPLLSGGEFQVPQIEGPVCQAWVGRLPD